MKQSTAETNSATTQLQKWLNSETALPVLKSVAKNVLSWAKRDNVIHEIIAVDSEEQYPELGVISFVLEVLFDPGRLESCRMQLAEHIDNGNMNSVKAILTSRIINYCIDERRKEEHSPFHHWFRRISTALSKPENGIRYVLREIGRKSVSYYAISTLPELPYLAQGLLGSDNYRGWPHPGFSLSEIKTMQLLSISRTFWDKALTELECEHFLPIKDLVFYFSAFYKFDRLIQTESGVSVERDDQEQQSLTEKLHDWQSHDTFGTLETQHSNVQKKLEFAALEKAALRLVASWNHKMQAALYLYMVEDMTLQQIAERINLNSPQAVSPYIKKAKSSLQEFFRQWQIEGYEDDAPAMEEQKFVLKVLIDYILKNCPECRDEE